MPSDRLTIQRRFSLGSPGDLRSSRLVDDRLVVSRDGAEPGRRVRAHVSVQDPPPPYAPHGRGRGRRFGEAVQGRARQDRAERREGPGQDASATSAKVRHGGSRTFSSRPLDPAAEHAYDMVARHLSGRVIGMSDYEGRENHDTTKAQIRRDVEQASHDELSIWMAVFASGFRDRIGKAAIGLPPACPRGIAVPKTGRTDDFVPQRPTLRQPL